ncbi:MAG: hypothetical protein K6F84_05260 [Lachnospiraceae bacterium]|nr:hypothetical protein [Lachnospiraceae bacterium]
MGFINEIIGLVNVIGITAILSMAVAGAILWYFVKVKKVTAKEENINTSSFKRENSLSYVPLKDIIYDNTLDSDGIIAISDSVFVAGLSVRGFDYSASSAQEKVDAQVNSVSFFNVVEEPTSFRQSVKGIDLSVNIADYEKIEKDIAHKLAELDAEFEETLKISEQYIEFPDEYERYDERLRSLQRSIAAYNHQLKECKALISYMEVLSKSSQSIYSAGQKTSQIMFSYTFDPAVYSKELSKEEIILKAKEALNMRASSYINALAYCHFRAKRLSARELVQLIRKHNFPLTGEDTDLEELLDSSYGNLFVSSDSLVEAQKEKIAEEEFTKHMDELNRQIEAQSKRVRDLMWTESQRLNMDSYNRAVSELALES